jgi:acetylornithine deacetylase/succinyl-diaminopimelate desuccinylase-like protein
MVENRRDFTKGIPILIRSFLEWDAPFGKPGGPKYHGLGLPRDVLEKIYHLNFETNFGNNPARLPTSSVKGGFSVNSVHPPTPVAIAQQLIRFNTTNPPGNEWECITFSRDLLQDAGIPTQMYARSTQRPNLIARLPGRGESSPLLLFGHVDVVPANDQDWIHPPFQAKIADGYLWGRGALDMKGGVAMMVSAILRAKGEGMQPPGDILLALVSDEEAGGDDGAGFLVNEHPELFHEVRYAIGEFGGFSLPIAGKRFYPIQVAEKQVCWVKCILRGKGGHGSMPVRDGAMDGLADLLHSVTRKRLPVHITPPARQMFENIAAGLGGIKGLLFHLLLVPGLTNPVLDLLGERSWAFDPLLHHTLSPTVVKGSSKINVIPEQVSIELDGRLLPGFQPEDLLSELRHICKPQVEFELIRHEPGPPKVDMSLFKVLAEILRESDPQGIPIPFLLSGFTDARHFSRLGIQSYGFLPMRLPDDFDFSNTIHAADERIPVEALEFGTTALLKAILRYG